MAYRRSRPRWVPCRPRRWLRRVRGLARAAGFWLAVALPLAYLPLMVLGPPVLGDPAAVGAAVGTNLLALVVGHGHDPSVRRRSG